MSARRAAAPPPPGRRAAVTLAALLLALAAGCGSRGDDELPAAAGADAHGPVPVPGRVDDDDDEARVATLGGSTGAVPAADPVEQAPPPLPGAPEGEVTFRRSPWAPGDRFHARTVMEIELDAEIGLGFLSQDIEYRRVEKEQLDVTVLAAEDEDDDALRRRLVFEQRISKSTLPIVGEKTKERRVHGKTFEVVTRDGTQEILNVRGGAVNEKLADEVGLSLAILGDRPVMFDVLPEGEVVSVEPGRSFDVTGDLARRIVGLPFEELGVDGLTLTLRRPEEPDDPLAVFDASASFSGSTDMGDDVLSMSASLSGEVTVRRSTMHVVEVRLKGRVEARQEATEDGGGFMSAKGDGPLVIRRTVTSG